MTSAMSAAPDLAPSAPRPCTQSNLESEARTFIAQDKFNKSFIIPATDLHDELTITYAVAGLDSDTAPTALFITGLYGARLLATLHDHLGQNLGMRIIVIDRPGMGGSTPVKASLRLSVWLEMMPILLQSINARHIHIFAHSCGVIYAFNTVYHMPWILCPSSSKLHLLSPWVNTQHSGLSIFTLVSYLPAPLINRFDSLVRGTNSVVAASAQISAVVSGPFVPNRSTNSPRDTNNDERSPRHERDDVCIQTWGISAAQHAARSKEILRVTFEQNTQGANHEALLAMRKTVAGGWGICDDYTTYPSQLSSSIRQHFQNAGSASDGEAPHQDEIRLGKRFEIITYWAEKDMLIDKKGQAYFDECFQKSRNGARSGDQGSSERSLGYEREVVAGATHDTVILPQYGAVERILRDMMGSSIAE